MKTNQQLVISNLEEKLKLFTHAVSGELIKEANYVIANTEIPTDTFNMLLANSPTIHNQNHIKQAINHFIVKELPFSTWVDANNLSNDWLQLIKEHNLKEAERNIMMKLDHTLHTGQRISNHLNITQVSNKEGLLQYKEVFLSLFEGTPERDALEIYFRKFSQEKLASNARMFIGCIMEMPVATGLLIEDNDSYGIYDVMTKETFRGKGYGSEMFQFLLNQTIDKQKPVVLQASEDGKNIYKRFGFKEVGEMIVFE
ncbi:MULTISPECIES: GNAT family N-acetyltransferase [Lysinibacillus]|uniref:GNAT family N-acetyltransferase n=1 Tax=Lysinibacillus TaxID=400634 RepID=UPI00257C069B|nr:MULTISPECIES: GNAT family N-acetyltransferase [Lysinibacillus]